MIFSNICWTGLHLQMCLLCLSCFPSPDCHGLTLDRPVLSDAVLSLQPNEFVHIGLIWHCPYLSALIPIIDLLEISCCLALSRFLNLQFLSLLIQASIQCCADTVDNTSTGLCWCPTFSQSQHSLHPFIRLQSQLLLQLSPAHFFFSGFPPAVLWFRCRLRLTSLSVTLGRCSTANQITGFERLFETSIAITILRAAEL